MTNETECPDAPELLLLLESALPEEKQESIGAHLESCTSCQERLEQMASGDSVLPAGPTPSTDRPAVRDLVRSLRDSRPMSGGGDEPPPLEFLDPCERPGFCGRFGPYDVMDVVGSGGMGIVLRAMDATLNRVVAIKVLAPELAALGNARKRFRREAQAAAGVSHDHVVTIHAVDEYHGLPYLVMQYVAGMSLEEHIRRDGTLELAEVLRIGMQVASGLAAAHTQGVVHRDIKPANILLENGIAGARITDFGLAKAVDDTTISHASTIVGTPAYMSPEQARGQRVDYRADLYGLGAVLYAMCTGRAPYSGDTPIVVLRKVCDDAPRPVAELAPETPAWLVEIVECLMAKEPGARYGSAADVADELARRLAGLQQGHRAPDGARRTGRRNPWLLAGALVVAAAAIGTAAIAWRNGWRTTAGPDGSPRPSTVPAAAPATTAPFAILGRRERFESLVDAVREAVDGDIIEIESDGAIVTDTVQIVNKSLTIRAAEGTFPSLQARLDDDDSSSLIITTSPLVLEGLDIYSPGEATPKPESGRRMLRTSIVRAEDAELTMTNCTVRGDGGKSGVGMSRGAVLRNCHIRTGWGPGLIWYPERSCTLAVDNCLIDATIGLTIQSGEGPFDEVPRLEISQSTVVGPAGFQIVFGVDVEHYPVEPLFAARSDGNLLDVRAVLVVTPDMTRPGARRSIDPADFTDPEKVMKKLISWEDRDTFFARNTHYIGFGVPNRPRRLPFAPLRLDSWNHLWGQADTGSGSGRVSYVPDAAEGEPAEFTVSEFSAESGSVPAQVGAHLESLGAGPR